MSIASLFNSELTFACLGFLMGMVMSWLSHREKMIREGNIRYYKCKECGREHALSYDGSWHALRTIEEIDEHKQRLKNIGKDPNE